jgi:glutamate synthase (NADPH) small chain
MDFLTANTRALLDGHKNGNYISAAGKDVLVIGGGDTGTDCVGTACDRAAAAWFNSRFCPNHPWKRAADNPWPEWPKVYQDGLRTGRGRSASLATIPGFISPRSKQFVGDDAGHVKEAVTVQIRWERDPQRPVPSR